MESYTLETLDNKKSNHIRAMWLEQIEQNDISSLQLVDSFFDYIISQNYFGELLDRSNQSTYLSVETFTEVVAIVEIIFVRQGSTTICKIMDVNYSPNVTKLLDEEYLNVTLDILMSILGQMLSINSRTKHGITKIYARDNAAQHTIKTLDKKMQRHNLQDELGFNVKLQGHHWLEFEKISQ